MFDLNDVTSRFCDVDTLTYAFIIQYEKKML